MMVRDQGRDRTFTRALTYFVCRSISCLQLLLGVMGALFRSAASAAQALLEKAGVSLQMHCVLQGARMLLPLSLWRRVAVVVDCKSVEVLTDNHL